MKNLIATFLILSPILVSAQDVLYKTDNTKQEVNVLEVGEATIKYKSFTNPHGPNYVINKNDVAVIVYKNGEHDVFKPAITSIHYHNPDSIKKQRRVNRYLKVTQYKNVVFLNTIELLNSGIGVSYLREFCDGRFNVHVPFSSSFKAPELDNALFGFGGGYGHKISRTHYDIGLGIYFNTRANSSVTHFIGPLIRNAQYSGTTSYWSIGPGNYEYGNTNFQMNETSFMVNNGFLYRITPNFNMMLNVAVGRFIDRRYSDNRPSDKVYSYGAPTRQFALQAGFHFGYRF